jgi:hypothetical protein
MTFFVIVSAIKSPTVTTRAVVPSCAREIVNISPVIAVTRTISAFVGSGKAPLGQIVALNGAIGKRLPCPAPTVSVVPEAGGLGVVATVATARFWCASKLGIATYRVNVPRIAS